jgi:hypothetical protein
MSDEETIVNAFVWLDLRYKLLRLYESTLFEFESNQSQKVAYLRSTTHSFDSRSPLDSSNFESAFAVVDAH